MAQLDFPSFGFKRLREGCRMRAFRGRHRHGGADPEELGRPEIEKFA
jgi:hypothetical protein